MDRCKLGPGMAVPVAGQQMGGMQPIRQAVAEGKHRDQVQPQAGHIHDILFTHLCTGKHGVNTAQAAQSSPGGADIGQGRDNDPVEVTDDNGFHLAGAMDEQAQLTVQLGRQGSQTPGQLPADDLIRSNGFSA